MHLINEGWFIFGAYEDNGQLRATKLEPMSEEKVISSIFGVNRIIYRLIAIKEDEIRVIKFNMSKDEFFEVFSKSSLLLKSELEQVVNGNKKSCFTKGLIKELSDEVLT